MLHADTCVADNAAIYPVTRIPYNSTDVIVRALLLLPRQRLDMVLGHFSHKPEEEVGHGFGSFVL